MRPAAVLRVVVTAVALARVDAASGRAGTPRLMRIALAAAGDGWCVFPLWPATKIPALHGARRCPHTGHCAAGHLGWEQRATRDPGLIRWWWRVLPFNIAIAVGRAGVHVLDLDPARGGSPPERWAGARHGRDVLTALAARAGEPYPDQTHMVATPSGGEHLYFRVPPTPVLRNTVGRVGWQVDSRGVGGYIVAPGSVTPTGMYRVSSDRPVAPLPTWLVPLLAPPPPPSPVPARGWVPVGRHRRRAYLHALMDRVAAAPVGTRRYTLLCVSYSLGRLVAGDVFTEHQARAALTQAAGRLRDFPAWEAQRTIDDGLRHGMRSPRRLAS